MLTDDSRLTGTFGFQETNMKRFSLAFAPALALFATAPASAAMFDFSFATEQQLFGGPVSGSGVFTTSDVAMTVGGQTAYAITSITGSVNGSAIVAPTGNYGNYFTTGPTFLDGSGTRFLTEAGNDISFFAQSSNGRYRVNTFGPGSSSFVTASSAAVAAVPETATWLMSIVGFGLIGGAMRLRRAQPVLATV
jgi:hypothetical protein